MDGGREGDQFEVEGEVELASTVSVSICYIACYGELKESTHRAQEERKGNGLLRARHGCVPGGLVKVSQLIEPLRVEQLWKMLLTCRSRGRTNRNWDCAGWRWDV